MNKYADVEGLRVAVVQQAVDDYKKFSKAIIEHNSGIKILEDKEFKKATKEIKDIEKFFLNKQYFALFSDWDGARVLNALKKQVAAM